MASASIKQLQDTLAQLQGVLQQVGNTAATTGEKMSEAAARTTATLQAEITAVNQEIAARGGQAAAIKKVTVALEEQATAAAVVHRTLQQGIDVSFGVGSDRAIKSAAASAAVLTTSLSAAAEADARFRDIQLSTTAALNDVTAATERAAGATKTLGRSRLAAGAEGAAGAAAGGAGAVEGGLLGAGAGAILTKESRHIVGLFDSLARGQRGQALSSIGAAARDAGLGIAALSTSMSGLVVLMGTAAILRGAESMGKWAENLRSTAAATGLTVRELSGLQAALVHTGATADSADSALRRFADNTSKAIANPKSDTADAWERMGVSLEELRTKGSTTSGALHLLADAFARTNDSENRTDAMTKIAGRGFETLIRIIQDGGPALDTLIAQMDKTGKVIDDLGANSLARTGEAVKSFGEKMSGDFTQAMIKAGGSVETFVEILVGLERALIALGGIAIAPIVIPYRIAKAGGQSAADTGVSMLNGAAEFNPYTLGQAPSTAAAPVAPIVNPDVAFGPMQGMKSNVGPPKVKGAEVSAESLMREQMNEAALAASKTTTNRADAARREGEAEIAVMQKTLQAATLTDTERTQIKSEMYAKQMSLNNQAMSAGAPAARQDATNYIAAERTKIAEANGNAATIKSIYDEMLTALETRYKVSAATISNIEREKVQAINTARLNEIKEGARTEEAVNRANILMGRASAISSGTMSYPGQKTIGGVETTGQGTAALASQAQQIEAAAQTEIASLREVMDTATKGSATQKQAAEEILSVEMQAKTQEIALYNQAAEASVKAAKKAQEAFEKVFDQMGSQIETFSTSLFKALVAPQQELLKVGLTTIRTNERGNEIRAAAGKAILGMADDLIKGIEGGVSKMAAQSLSKMLSIPISAGGGMGDLLSSGLTKILGIGGGAAAQMPQAAQFGLAGTQLQLAATQLSAAAVALSTSAGASGGAGVGGGGASVAGAVAGGGGFFSGIGSLLRVFLNRVV